MRKLLFILLLLPLQITAQVNLDSLWSVWNDPNQTDTIKIMAIYRISVEGYLYSQPDSAFIFGQLIYEYAKEKELKKYMAQALHLQGASYYIQADYNNAMKYYLRSLAILEEVEDLPGIAASSNNIGLIYKEQGNYSKSIAYLMRSLKIDEKLGDQEGVSFSLNNIGNIYEEQGDNDRALDFYMQSLNILLELGNEEGDPEVLNNIGNIYNDQGDYEKALDFHRRSLKIEEKIGNKQGITGSLINIGLIYQNQGELAKALDFYTRSLKIAEEVGDKQKIASSLSVIGLLYQEQGNYEQALDFINRGLSLAQEIGFLELIKNSAESLWKINREKGKYKTALEMYQMFVSSRDSMESEENQKEIIRQEYKYTYEKQAAIDSIQASEEGKVKDALLQSEKAENLRRKQQSYFLYGGLVLALIFGGFIFNRYKVTNQQKEVISEQKEKVDNAYAELEDKNQKILDSIVYAKRIQNAILPPVKVVKEYLHESFIIYLPKDVVAGDFYWLESKGKKTFFAAADCTGHGVPGAMVSVVCNNGLNRSVREYEITDPGKILDKTREIVVQEFEKSEEEVKDGMDIALCSLEGKTLEYAGAHNPLVIIRKDAEECEVVKPNKEPIGQFDNPKPYTTHTVELHEGDSIYLFSDGLQDQFGGPKGKKFMIARFKKLLIEVSKEPMDKQKELILKAFKDWKGDEEQVDDVCLIGVRV